MLLPGVPRPGGGGSMFPLTSPPAATSSDSTETTLSSPTSSDPSSPTTHSRRARTSSGEPMANRDGVRVENESRRKYLIIILTGFQMYNGITVARPSGVMLARICYQSYGCSL
ncbi:hypothetical protein MLD38_037280 [Melastoma candidum]|uniref:Uncharacterized protein n=1 Tax=Melastoma candidum TaxID=119954 RepID=A0ACB9LMD4_9MYRT|nr:hypothetical protein MLD38_037280 [Melastoma candidum]